MLNIGDKVKLSEKCIKDNKDTLQEFEDMVGEITKIDKIYNYYKVKIGAHPGLWFDQYDIVLTDSVNKAEKTCICTGNQLLWGGCNCGAMKNE